MCLDGMNFFDFIFFFFWPELNCIYCTKKVKPSQMSPGMSQVRTAAKGSVDTGPSFPKTKSKEGALAPDPAGSQALARLPLTSQKSSPSLPHLPEEQPLGHPPQNSPQAQGSQAREGPIGRRWS